MGLYEFARGCYRRMRYYPFVGRILRAIRFGRVPLLSRIFGYAARDKDVIEAYGYVFSGLKNSQENLKKKILLIDSGLNERLDFISESVARLRSDIEGRIEFVRQEILFEKRYGFAGVTEVLSECRVINLTKVDGQRSAGSILLNVGCGHKPLVDYINVDVRDLPGVDVVAPVESLPFGFGEVSEIYSSHLLEHFPIEKLNRNILPKWVSLLKEGGRIRAVVPDSSAMIESYSKKEISFSELSLIIFGGQEYEGDFHYSMFTPESLVELFSASGLVDVNILAANRRNGLCYECEVVGTKL